MQTGQAGFSYVELMIVIVIISIVAAMAMMQRGSANEQFQRQNAARELKVALERARFDSVKRRTNCYERAKVDITASSYTLSTNVVDADMNGTPESAETVTIDLPSHIVISDAGTVKFNMRGEAQSATAMSYRVCNVSCTGTPSNSTSDLLIVTPTGTVSLLPGAATPVPFGAPGNGPDTSGSVASDRLLMTGSAPVACVP
jgi:prepilin-type N-terminal cleavage/methylation domain-containing protein